MQQPSSSKNVPNPKNVDVPRPGLQSLAEDNDGIDDFSTSDDDLCDDEHTSFDTDYCNDALDQMDLNECIRYWALKTNQSHESINLIMEIIRRKTNEKRLPRSARTLLKTSRSATSEIVAIAGGQFWYKGIKRNLCDYFR